MEKILDKTRDLINQLEYDLAHKFILKALGMEPQNPEALELGGAICMEVGAHEEAAQYFQRWLQQCPETAVSAYLSLAQLRSGEEAVALWQQGIALLARQLEDAKENAEEEESSNLQELKRQLSQAHCSLSEVYTTDCCDLPEAEQRCDFHVQEALKVDSTNPEAWIQMAALRLLQQRYKEAKEACFQGMQLWLPPAEEQDEENVDEMILDENGDPMMDAAGTAPQDLQPMPCLPSRITLAKSLIQLHQYQQCMRVLPTIQQEDEECLELWYLYALCYWMLGCQHALQLQQTDRNESLKTDEEAGIIENLQDRIEAWLEAQWPSTAPEKPSNAVPEDTHSYWLAAQECLDEGWKVYQRHGEACIQSTTDGSILLDDIYDLVGTLRRVLPK